MRQRSSSSQLCRPLSWGLLVLAVSHSVRVQAFQVPVSRPAAFTRARIPFHRDTTPFVQKSRSTTFSPSSSSLPVLPHDADKAVGQRGRSFSFSFPLASLFKPAHRSNKPQKRTASNSLRILLSVLAVVCLTGTVAHALPKQVVSASLTHPGSSLLSAATASAAPFSILQESLAKTLGQGPLAPVAVLLSWLLDVLEVGADLSGALFRLLLWPLLTPLNLLLRHVLLPVLPFSRSLLTSPQGTLLPILTQLLHGLGSSLAQLQGGLAAYANGILALLLSTLGIIYQTFCNGLGLFFNLPGLQFFDGMDPRLQIPSTPIRFVLPSSPSSVPASLPTSSGSTFSLRQMYGRRWRVHAGKWSWVVPYWERVVMEAQLARYQNTFEKSAIKARFGFPEVVRGPSPFLGGTLIILTVRGRVGRKEGGSSQLQAHSHASLPPFLVSRVHFVFPPSLASPLSPSLALSALLPDLPGTRDQRHMDPTAAEGDLWGQGVEPADPVGGGRGGRRGRRGGGGRGPGMRKAY